MGNPFWRSVISPVIGDLLSPEACLLSHLSHSYIHFGIFRQQNGNLLSNFAFLLTHFSVSRIHFSIFRKRNGRKLANFAYLLSDFSNSRIHPSDRSKINVNTNGKQAAATS
ncbi:hypothetical protein [Microseira wollei]|uniref:hypothetical protein n=1 Tax=Microseira wollei TaxID=467598 RepID=UPI001CFC4FC6|nr:hypothetical protein [Microseira wollei]